MTADGLPNNPVREGHERARAFSRALEALRDGDVTAASAVADDLRRQAPQDAGVQQLLAAIALQKQEPAEAERWALASLAGRPDHAATWVLAARAALALANLPAALERFGRAAELDPARPEAAFGAAIAGVFLRNDTVQAASGDLSRRFPAYTPGWVELGSACERSAHWDGAAQAFAMALRSRPNAKLCIRLGSALHALGRRGEAAAAFGKALELDPASSEAWFRLGLTLQDSRRFDEAADAYRRALSLSPDFVEAHTNLGVVLQERGDLAGAKKAYGRAIVLRPSVFGRIAQALTTAPYGELWLDLAALRDHLSELGRLSR